MSCPKCGGGMHYVMLGATGYMECGSCGYVDIPKPQYQEAVDEDNVFTKCEKCGTSVKRLMFTYNENGLVERFVRCPKCEHRHVLEDDETRRLIIAYLGFDAQNTAYRLCSETEGQMMLDYTKEHRDQYNPIGEERTE